MDILDPNKVDKIIIHCTDTECTSAVNVETVIAWHKARGFATIGYHWMVLADGTIVPGRDQSFIGAHCLGQNKRSIGVCYVGGRVNGIVKDSRNIAQKLALSWIIRDLVFYYPNIRYVYGHNDFSVKSCPCFDVKKEYQSLVDKLLLIKSTFKS